MTPRPSLATITGCALLAIATFFVCWFAAILAQPLPPSLP